MRGLKIFDSAKKRNFREAVPALLGAGLAALILLVTGHGDAVASPQTDFVAQVRQQGLIQDDVSDQVAIALGEMICVKLEQGFSEKTIADSLMDTKPPTPAMVAYGLVDDAQDYLCSPG